MQQTSTITKTPLITRAKLTSANYYSKTKFEGAVAAAMVIDTFENDNSSTIEHIANFNTIYIMYTTYQGYAVDNQISILTQLEIDANRTILFDPLADPQAHKVASSKLAVHKQVSDHLLQLRRSLTNILDLNKSCENALLSCFDPDLTAPLRLERMALTDSLDLRSSQTEIERLTAAIAARTLDRTHVPLIALPGQAIDPLARLISTNSISDMSEIRPEQLYTYLTFRSSLTKHLTQLNAQQTMAFISEMHDHSKHILLDSQKIKDYLF